MVKRKSLTLAQARRSLRAFYAQKAGKRRGCGSEHKRRSKRRGNKRGGNQALKAAQMQRDILRTAQTSKNMGLNQADTFNRMTKHHDDSDLRSMQRMSKNKFRNLVRNEAADLDNTPMSMAQKRQMQGIARKTAPALNKMSVTPRGSFEVGGRRKKRSKRRGSHGKKRSRRKGSHGKKRSRKGSHGKKRR